MTMQFAKDTRTTVVPGLRYRDCHKAIEWLVTVLGFEQQVVFEGPGNTIAHAQLTFGNGMIMLGSASNPGELARYLVEPADIGNRETQSTSLIVADASALHARASAAGAEIILDLREMDYGGMAFTCRDPEGHLWSIGEFDPWAPM